MQIAARSEERKGTVPERPKPAERIEAQTKARGRRYEVGPCYWQSPDGRDYFFRAPSAADGAALWELARASGVLEVNSPYSYLLLAEHFTDTCVVVERDSKPVAFVCAFVSPAARDTLFVWQVAVAPNERGHGLAGRLLSHLLARPACRHIRRLEATVATSNAASRALFESVARELDVPFTVYPGFGPELFPGSAHEREELVRIGPLPRPARGRSPRRAKPATERRRHPEEQIGEQL